MNLALFVCPFVCLSFQTQRKISEMIVGIVGTPLFSPRSGGGGLKFFRKKRGVDKIRGLFCLLKIISVNNDNVPFFDDEIANGLLIFCESHMTEKSLCGFCPQNFSTNQAAQLFNKEYLQSGLIVWFHFYGNLRS